MRFLVINNYSKVGERGLKQFEKFVTLLRNSVEGSGNISDLSNDYTLVENPDEIDRYLVDPVLVSGHTDSKAFDLVDMVFVIGNSTSLPWSNANIKVPAFLRRC